ncbi:MAG: DUF192 domain-containing protein [Bacilli bacterium]
MSRRTRVLVGVVLVELIVAAGLLVVAYRPVQRERAMLRIGAWQGEVWVADTPAERHRGLMGQTDLAQSGVKGMLFLFPPHHLSVFWMKDTPEPLWLLFVRRGKVEEVEYMPPCTSGHVCPRYPATGPVQAAVEISPAAWRGVKTAVGMTVTWRLGV